MIFAIFLSGPAKQFFLPRNRVIRLITKITTGYEERLYSDAKTPVKPPAGQSRTGSSTSTVGVLIQAPCAVPDPNGRVQTPTTTLEEAHPT